MQKYLKSIVFLVLFSFGFSNIVFGLLPGAKVLLADGQHKMAKDLKKGDLIPIFDLKDKCLKVVPKEIAKIRVKSFKELVVIKTDKGLLIFGPKQKIYNRKVFKFIPAKDLKVGDILYSPELKNLEIKKISIEKFQYKKKLYSISIKDGNLFLTTMYGSNHVLLHNEPVTLTILALTWGGGIAFEWVTAAGVGIFLAGVLAHKAKGKLRRGGFDVSGFDILDPSSGRCYSDSGQSCYGNSSGFKDSTSSPKPPKKDPNDNETNGEKISRFIKNGFSGVNVQDSDPRTPVGRRGMSSKDWNTCIEFKDTVVSGRRFSGHAIDRMNHRGFVPSVVENAIKNGVTSPNKVAGRLTHYDAGNNITVITEQASGDVVTIFNGMI